MRACKPGMMEYQIEAELEYEFLKGGAHSSAYPSIVAGGANSCILHYTENRDKLVDGDLLLIDAGAEIDCYAADITRTLPVNGTYSAEQRAVYDIVLDAQVAAIAEVKSGHHWNQPHEAAVKRLAQGMIDLGLLEGGIEDVIENKRYQRFYMHRTGHWLGMDVHDVGDYRLGDQWRLLEPGMVLTVEPGLYIPAADDIDQRWHNIGIRIEDDVLVTRKNAQVLSGGVPKQPAEVEALMAEGVGS
jgi:Xaa-Pro aminopeptidase